MAWPNVPTGVAGRPLAWLYVRVFKDLEVIKLRSLLWPCSWVFACPPPTPTPAWAQLTLPSPALPVPSGASPGGPPAQLGLS